MKRMPTLAALAALACTGCGDSTGAGTGTDTGSSGACSAYLGDWAGTLAYSWPAGTGFAAGSGTLHVTFTASSCGPYYADLNMLQVNITAGTIDNTAWGTFSSGAFHAPYNLPPTAPSGSASWDWFLTFAHNVSTDSRFKLTFSADGKQLTGVWSDPGTLHNNGSVPTNAVVTAGAMEIHHK